MANRLAAAIGRRNLDVPISSHLCTTVRSSPGSWSPLASGLRQPWPCARFEDLTPEHFAQLAGLETELVIFGSGLRNRFPPPAWLAPLITRRLGLETMDTQAACRTYNILASEGRNVVAALILEV